jgi:hypothetical protein
MQSPDEILRGRGLGPGVVGPTQRQYSDRQQQDAIALILP